MSLLRAITSGLRALFRRERAYRELDEELRGFLDMPADEKMKRGMSRKAAVRVVRLDQMLPGVESAGATLALPIQGQSWNVGFKIDGHAYASLMDQPEAEARIVSNNFFEVMKIPLRRGRFFSEHDTKDSPTVAVI